MTGQLIENNKVMSFFVMSDVSHLSLLLLRTIFTKPPLVYKMFKTKKHIPRIIHPSHSLVFLLWQSDEQIKHIMHL